MCKQKTKKKDSKINKMKNNQGIKKDKEKACKFPRKHC
jgi:hypothetical protein